MRIRPPPPALAFRAFRLCSSSTEEERSIVFCQRAAESGDRAAARTGITYANQRRHPEARGDIQPIERLYRPRSVPRCGIKAAQAFAAQTPGTYTGSGFTLTAWVGSFKNSSFDASASLPSTRFRPVIIDSLSEAIVDALMGALTHVILGFLGGGEGAIGR